MAAATSPDQYVPQTIRTHRPLVVWFGCVIVASLIVALVLIAPIELANNHSAIAITIYRAFSKVCHQQPGRSFFIAGYPLAVCARCTGLYVGFTFTLILYPLIVSLNRTFTPPRKWLILATMPLAIDFGLNFLGIWTNTHSSRLLTGLLLGSVAVFYVMPGMMDLALGGWRIFSPRQYRASVAMTAPGASIAAAPSDYSAPHRRI